MSEHELQALCLEILKAHGIFHWRNSVGVKGGYTYGKKGSPDIIAVYKGHFIGIEVKDKNGKQNEDQIKFQTEIEKAGGTYLLVNDINILINYLKYAKTKT